MIDGGINHVLAAEIFRVTFSLDRIDSKIGYIEGNVQWVHKMVNMCKQHYTQEEFLEMCVSIADKVKWSPSKTASSSKKWKKG